jgi:hypothetical protein
MNIQKKLCFDRFSFELIFVALALSHVGYIGYVWLVHDLGGRDIGHSVGALITLMIVRIYLDTMRHRKESDEKSHHSFVADPSNRPG